jgi:hypothetical protein
VIHQFDKERYCEDPLAYGDHKVSIKDLAKNYTETAPVVAKKDKLESVDHVTIDLYSNSSTKYSDTNESSSVVEYEMDIK